MPRRSSQSPDGLPLLLPLLRGVQRRFPRFASVWADERRERLRYAIRGAVHELASIPVAAAATGDLLVWSGARLVRLAVGADGEVLTADSSEASGLAWSAAAGGGSSEPDWTNADYRVFRWSANIAAAAMFGAGYGNMSQTAPGGNQNLLQSDGAWREVKTNTAANSVSEYKISGATTNPIAEIQWSPRLQIRFKTFSDISNCTMFVGFWKNNGSVDNNLAKSEHRAGISFVAGTDTYWQLDESDGSTRTKTATTVTPAADTVYLLSIEWNSVSSRFDVTINGSAVGSMSTSLPAATDPLGIWINASTISSGTQQGIRVNSVSLRTL